MIPVESDYWIRYSEAQTNAAALAGYALLLAVVLAVKLPAVTNAYVFVNGILVGVVGIVWLLDTARSAWSRARLARIGYEAEQEAAAVFVSMFATTVLGALQAAADGSGET